MDLSQFRAKLQNGTNLDYIIKRAIVVNLLRFLSLLGHNLRYCFTIVSPHNLVWIRRFPPASFVLYISFPVKIKRRIRPWKSTPYSCSLSSNEGAVRENSVFLLCSTGITRLLRECKVDSCQSSGAFRFYTRLKGWSDENPNENFAFYGCQIFPHDCRKRSVNCFFCYASLTWWFIRLARKYPWNEWWFFYTFDSFKTQDNSHQCKRAPETCTLHLKK